MLAVAFLVNTYSRCWWHQSMGLSRAQGLSCLRNQMKSIQASFHAAYWYWLLQQCNKCMASLWAKYCWYKFTRGHILLPLPLRLVIRSRWMCNECHVHEEDYSTPYIIQLQNVHVLWESDEYYLNSNSIIIEQPAKVSNTEIISVVHRPSHVYPHMWEKSGWSCQFCDVMIIYLPPFLPAWQCTVTWPCSR